jgi:hypothetical protein
MLGEPSFQQALKDGLWGALLGDAAFESALQGVPGKAQ